MGLSRAGMVRRRRGPRAAFAHGRGSASMMATPVSSLPRRKLTHHITPPPTTRNIFSLIMALRCASDGDFALAFECNQLLQRAHSSMRPPTSETDVALRSSRTRTTVSSRMSRTIGSSACERARSPTLDAPAGRAVVHVTADAPNPPQPCHWRAPVGTPISLSNTSKAWE
jgi:hypothetical protein